MELRVYQINMARDKQRVKFQPLDEAVKQTGKIDAAIYDKVFDGELACKDLEEVFETLNSWSPPGYTGHSLYVSDVVKTAEGCFYCDLTDFKPVEFDASMPEDMQSAMDVY